MFIRRLKSRNGNIQIQVVKKVNSNNRLVKHLGTARNSLEVQQLTELARQYIDEVRIKSGKISFFDSKYTQSEMSRFLSHLLAVGAFDSVTFRFFNYFYESLGFHSFTDACFRDLVIARIVHPVSKIKTREWLETKLYHKYSLTMLYLEMEKAYRLQYQKALEQSVWKAATTVLLQNTSVLFFAVTTLHYQAFDKDDLGKYRYSKYKKNNRPQLVITLAVTTQGFPLQVKVFPGNKFEGQTMIPCIRDIINNHQLKDFVFVADSAMVTSKNLDDLDTAGIKFIVGTKLGDFSQNIFYQVVGDTERTDGSSRRFNLGQGRILVVGYSTKRANKDRTVLNKQVIRAKLVLANPATISKHYKFLKRAGKDRWELNQANIKKATQLEGLKGYVTNAKKLSDKEIISKYASLRRVERSFRISKSDLKARPIFHAVREKIEAHIAVVFAGLAITRYVEHTTGKSLQKVIDLLDSVKEVVLKDPVSGEVFSKYTQTDNPEIITLLKHANISIGDINSA